MSETGEPGETFGRLRKVYEPLRKRAEKKLIKAGVQQDVAFSLARKAFARESYEASRDYVTGLPVRRAFEERRGEEIERARRFKHPLTFVLIDLNDLRGINGEGGYSAGDKALRTIANILSQNTRKTDFLARYGGDEFAVLLTETPIEKTDSWWERISSELGKTPYPVTAVAIQIDPENYNEEVIKRMSHALTKEKERNGRRNSSLVKIE